MAQNSHLVRRLGLEPRDQAKLQAKAGELQRLAVAKLGVGGLGQGELCAGAACVELAAAALGIAVDAAVIMKCSAVKEAVYRNTKAALQKVLGLAGKASVRELCVQFGCARHDAAVRACLAAFKERFVRSLPPAQQAHVDFSRPAFLASAFYLVARKNKVAVDRLKLLGPLGVTATEFTQVTTSMADLCHDLVGTEPRKRRAGEVAPEARALLDRTGAAGDEDEVASDSGDEVEDEGMVGHRLNPKKQRQREYEAWKAKVTAKDPPADSTNGANGASGNKEKPLTEKALRQAVLSFAAAPAAAGAAPAAAAGAGPGSSGGGGAAGEPAAAAAPTQQQGAKGAKAASSKKPLAGKNS